ncbi:YtzI protein [Oceanobacillus salinisoli]|uniref:YtzI protein n=1 Tax=Oceanobacillus salinisoli TaxID=2678611 RepID=UPI0012E23207|nr:YtzI protein [Oceanobacillus salinisoli]
MSTLVGVILSVIIVILILLLTMTQIKKGYEYKHTIDPLPGEDIQEEKSDIK